MTDQNPEPPHGDPNRGLISDRELPEDLQPDEEPVDQEEQPGQATDQDAAQRHVE